MILAISTVSCGQAAFCDFGFDEGGNEGFNSSTFYAGSFSTLVKFKFLDFRALTTAHDMLKESRENRSDTQNIVVLITSKRFDPNFSCAGLSKEEYPLSFTIQVTG